MVEGNEGNCLPTFHSENALPTVFTSATEAMFLPLLDCLSVSRTAEKLDEF